MSAVAKIPKPQMRNLMISSVKFHVPMACLFGLAGSFAMYYLYAKPRADKMREFFRTYDAEKEAIYLEGLSNSRFPKQYEDDDD